MSVPVNLPAKAIVIPSNLKVIQGGASPIFQKVKRRVKAFKMSKKQRDRISAASRKFKIPILTGIAIAPAVFVSAQRAMAVRGLIPQASVFARTMLEMYTGIVMNAAGTSIRWDPKLLLIGWGPIAGVIVAKKFAKGTLASINRALSQAQIPARAS